MHTKSFRARLRLWVWIANLSLIATVSFGQSINVIKITGNTAEITEGTAGGIRKGDSVKISRMAGGVWSEITTAQVVQSDYNTSLIQIPEGAAKVKLGDKVEKIPTPVVTKKKKNPVSTTTETSRQTPVRKEPVRQPVQTASQPSRQPSNTSLRRTVNPSQQIDKKVYLGPQIGVFIPVGDMADFYESSFAYGGIIGAQFRRNLDICLQFFFAAQKNKWSFWTVQMLGRRYLNENFLFEFGYSVAYPENLRAGFAGGGNIQLGLCTGLTYSAPLSGSMWFELGALYQIYPNFGEKAGQFVQLQGRLLL